MYGAVAGAVSKILIYPLDTGKKLLQVYRLSPQKASIAVFLKQHFQATGVRGLYAGVVTATLKSALSSSLLFGFFALSKLWLHPSQVLGVCLSLHISSLLFTLIHPLSKHATNQQTHKRDYSGRTYLLP